MATCGPQGNCSIKNDYPTRFMGNVTMFLLYMALNLKTVVKQIPVDLPAGAGTIHRFQPFGNGTWNVILSGYFTDVTRCALSIEVNGLDGRLMSEHTLVLTEPKNLKLSPSKITFSIDSSGVIALQSSMMALYVTLTTQSAGRFSDNAFTLHSGLTRISFIPFGKLDLQLLRRTLRVEHLQEYL